MSNLTLPSTTAEQVAQFTSEWESAFNGRSAEELENAKCMLIWALVHSESKAHVRRGVEMVRAALQRDARSGDQDREMKYFLTVGLYKMGSYLDARAAALDLKSDYPEFRQVDVLKDEIDTCIIKDGLVGVGVLGALAAAAVGIAVGIARSRH